MSGFKFVDYSRGQYLGTKELPVSDEQDIRRTLHMLQQQDPSFVDLISPTGESLTIGVGPSLGCVMFTSASGDPPYLCAVADSNGQAGEIEFDAGGTPTPVPLYRCLPFETVIEIVVYYFLNGKLPMNIKWDAD
jgi:hypothetical protein